MNATPPPQKPKNRLAGRIVAAFCVVAGIITVTILVTTLMPIDLGKLSVEYPAIEDRANRLPSRGKGCALDESGDVGACKKVEVASVREEEVTFASSIPEKGLATLRGTLSIPAGFDGQRRPAVILVHGSGPNDRHEKVPGDLVSKVDPPFAVFDALADFFAHEGLVVLRYDKRACLRCYPEFKREELPNFSWLDYEVDAKDALDFLAKRAEVDPAALVVVGHSEGGQLAPFIAHAYARAGAQTEAHTGERVAAVIMLSGLTEGFDEALVAQLDRLAAIRRAQFDRIGSFSVGAQKTKFASCFDRLRTAYVPDEMCMGGGVTQRALKEFIEHEKDTTKVLGELDCPVFALQGSVDRNIDPLEMKKLAVAMQGRDHELHYVPGVNHLLMNVVTRTSPPSLDADVRRRLSAFLASVKR